MTKEVILSIKGLQFENEDEPIEVISHGNYYLKNGKHYIRFEEVSDDNQVTSSTIKIGNESVEVIRKGSSNSHMIFQERKTNMTYYNTPFGNLLIGINAKNIEKLEMEHELNIHIEYGLEVNYEHVSDCDININVKSKENSDFHLI